MKSENGEKYEAVKNAIEGLIRFKLNNEKEAYQIFHTAFTLCLNDSLTFDENQN